MNRSITSWSVGTITKVAMENLVAQMDDWAPEPKAQNSNWQS